MRFRLRSDRLLWIASWLSVRARRRQRSCAYGLRQSCRAPQAARVWRNRHVHLACTTADASKSAGRRQDRTLPPGTRTPSFAGGCVVHGLAWRRSHGLNAQRFARLRRTGRNPPHAKPGTVRIPTRGPVQGTGVYAWTELAFRIMPTNARKPRRVRVMSNRLAQGHGHARWRHGYGKRLDLYLEFIDSGRSRSWFPCRAAPNPQSATAIFAGMGAGHGRLPASRKGRQSEAACQAQGYVDLAVPSAAPAGCRRNANRKFPPPTGQDTSGFYAALSNAG